MTWLADAALHNPINTTNNAKERVLLNILIAMAPSINVEEASSLLSY
jgi:hypothetical protein